MIPQNLANINSKIEKFLKRFPLFHMLKSLHNLLKDVHKLSTVDMCKTYVKPTNMMFFLSIYNKKEFLSLFKVYLNNYTKMIS